MAPHNYKEVIPNVYQIDLGANAFLIDQDGLTLIDAGVPGSIDTLKKALAELRRRPDEIRNILVTHAHGDHVGGLSEIKKLCGAPVYMHQADATMARKGKSFRNFKPAPGIINRLICSLVVNNTNPKPYPLAEVENEISDGAELNIAGGIQAFNTPGHSAGHMVFFWPQQGGVLFAGDTASNMFGLGYSIGYEDLNAAQKDLARLSRLKFEVACFGHGKPILKKASDKFKKKWGPK